MTFAQHLKTNLSHVNRIVQVDEYFSDVRYFKTQLINTSQYYFLVSKGNDVYHDFSSPPVQWTHDTTNNTITHSGLSAPLVIEETDPVPIAFSVRGSPGGLQYYIAQFPSYYYYFNETGKNETGALTGDASTTFEASLGDGLYIGQQITFSNSDTYYPLSLGGSLSLTPSDPFFILVWDGTTWKRLVLL